MPDKLESVEVTMRRHEGGWKLQAVLRPVPSSVRGFSAVQWVPAAMVERDGVAAVISAFLEEVDRVAAEEASFPSL